MTKQEFFEITKKLQAIYTNQRFMEKQETLDVWFALFQDIPLNAMAMAVSAHVMESPYPPTPADINKQLMRFKQGNADSLASPEEAWTMVRKAVSRSSYYSEEEYAKLPGIVQKAVGSHENLRAWAAMDSEEFETVQKSHFVKSYNGHVQRERNDERLPKGMRVAVQNARRNPELEQYRNSLIEDKSAYEAAMEVYEETVKSKTGEKDSFTLMLEREYNNGTKRGENA